MGVSTGPGLKYGDINNSKIFIPNSHRLDAVEAHSPGPPLLGHSPSPVVHGRLQHPIEVGVHGLAQRQATAYADHIALGTLQVWHRQLGELHNAGRNSQRRFGMTDLIDMIMLECDV